MSTIAAVILWFGVTCYAVFGGADYGAGFWDLTAGGAKRGARPRALIDQAMAPVWEANNVWLIFALVVLWTAFPARVRVDHVGAVRAAEPGRGRNRPARLRVRVPQVDPGAGRTAARSARRSRCRRC